jgi:hypothetical protein
VLTINPWKLPPSFALHASRLSEIYVLVVSHIPGDYYLGYAERGSRAARVTKLSFLVLHHYYDMQRAVSVVQDKTHNR